MALSDALTSEFPRDAHLLAYASPNRRRLKRDAVPLLDGITLSVVVFDLDDEAMHKTGKPARAEWRAEMREKVMRLLDVHPCGYYYETKGGARLVYTHATPTTLRTKEDEVRWQREYLVACAYLRRRFDIHADPACCDWTRLFRLPHATRDGGKKPENWPTFGDPHQIGALVISPSAEDIETAKTLNKRTFRKPKHYPTTMKVDRVDGYGILYYALDARNEVSRHEHRGGWVCLCPNRAQHGKNTDGRDTTIYLPPNPARRIPETGLLDCKHGHCREFTLSDWLRFFSKEELAAAALKAGKTTIELWVKRAAPCLVCHQIIGEGERATWLPQRGVMHPECSKRLK